MKRLLCWLQALLLLSPLACAQAGPGPLPALHRALAQARADTTRGRLCWAVSEIIESNDSIIYFAQQAIPLLQRAASTAQGAERRRLLGLLGGAINNLAFGLNEQGEQQRAASLYQRAAALRQQGGDVRGQVESYENLGLIYQQQGDYTTALRYYQQGVKAGEHVPAARSKVAKCLAFIGFVYSELHDPTSAVRYQKQALALLEQGGESSSLPQAFNLLAGTYLHTLNDTAHAEFYLRRTLRLAPHTPGTGLMLLQAWQMLGQIRLLQHRLPQARALLLTALAGAKANRYVSLVNQLHVALAQVEEESGHLTLALRYVRQNTQNSYRGTLSDRLYTQKLLAHLYEKLRQPVPALDHYRRFRDLQDSVANETNKRQALRRALSFDYSQKAAALQAAQKERELIDATILRNQELVARVVLAFVLLLLLLAVVLASLGWRNSRRKQQVNQQLTTQNLQIAEQRDHLARTLDKLKATQQQLIQKEKMASLGELAAGIAHEIQNPLNFVNNFADVSQELVQELREAQTTSNSPEALALADDLAQNLGRIHQHGQRAANIVRGMLEHSRASSGEFQLVAVNDLCEEYLHLAYHGVQVKDKGFAATLATDFAAGLPPVEATPGDLGRVLLNLLTNAFYAVRQRQHASESGYLPTVRLATQPVGGGIEIRVMDNGAGMSEAVAAKVFQPFFTTKPAGEGTGLGLSLSYDIITQGHGGTLSVASQPGQGSVFTVWLPVA